jgi:hypothetical protein
MRYFSALPVDAFDFRIRIYRHAMGFDVLGYHRNKMILSVKK